MKPESFCVIACKVLMMFLRDEERRFTKEWDRIERGQKRQSASNKRRCQRMRDELKAAEEEAQLETASPELSTPDQGTPDNDTSA